MTSTFESEAGILRITLTGDLIGGADAMKFAGDLREHLTQYPSHKQNDGTERYVEADASGVGFVNSSGLGMLIAARQMAVEHGAEFRLCASSEQLRHLLEVTKLTKMFGAE